MLQLGAVMHYTGSNLWPLFLFSYFGFLSWLKRFCRGCAVAGSELVTSLVFTILVDTVLCYAICAHPPETGNMVIFIIIKKLYTYKRNNH